MQPNRSHFRKPRSPLPILFCSPFMASRLPYLRYLPKDSVSTSPEHHFYICPAISQHLAAYFKHTHLVWQTKQSSGVGAWGLWDSTQSTLEAWLHPKVNKIFLRNKVICTDPPCTEKIESVLSHKMIWADSSTCLMSSRPLKTDPINWPWLSWVMMNTCGRFLSWSSGAQGRPKSLYVQSLSLALLESRYLKMPFSTAL